MGRAFSHRLRVRYGECDPQGVVFNANYLMYFDVAFTELWRDALGPYGEMVSSGTDLVVAEANIRFLSGAGFDDDLDIELAGLELGRTSMTTTFAFRRDGDPVAEGRLRHVFVEAGTVEKKPIPDDVRAGLAPYATP